MHYTKMGQLKNMLYCYVLNLATLESDSAL